MFKRFLELFLSDCFKMCYISVLKKRNGLFAEIFILYIFFKINSLKIIYNFISINLRAVFQ